MIFHGHLKPKKHLVLICCKGSQIGLLNKQMFYFLHAWYRPSTPPFLQPRSCYNRVTTSGYAPIILQWEGCGLEVGIWILVNFPSQVSKFGRIFCPYSQSSLCGHSHKQTALDTAPWQIPIWNLLLSSYGHFFCFPRVSAYRSFDCLYLGRPTPWAENFVPIIQIFTTYRSVTSFLVFTQILICVLFESLKIETQIFLG